MVIYCRRFEENELNALRREVGNFMVYLNKFSGIDHKDMTEASLLVYLPQITSPQCQIISSTFSVEEKGKKGSERTRYFYDKGLKM